MKTPTPLLFVPLLLACRSPLTEQTDLVDAGPLVLDSVPDTLTTQAPLANEMHCPSEIRIEGKWETPWSPYGIWNRLLSFSPDGQELLIASGIYLHSPWNHFFDTRDGTPINGESDELEQDFDTHYGTIIQRDRKWGFDVRRNMGRTPVLTVMNTTTLESMIELSTPGDLTGSTWALDAHVQISDNGEWLSLFGFNGDSMRLGLWHVPSRKLVGEKIITEAIFYWGSQLGNGSLSNDGVLFYGNDESDTLHRFDLLNDRIESVTLPETGLITVDLSQSEDELRVVGRSGALHRLSPETLDDKAPLLITSVNQLNRGLYAPFFEVSPIASSQDGILWASLGPGGEVQIRSHCSDAVLAEIEMPELDADPDSWPPSLQAYSLAFNANTTQLAVAREGTLSVWDIEVID